MSARSGGRGSADQLSVFATNVIQPLRAAHGVAV